MTTAAHEKIRNLAQPLWESAARPYGMALDFWLMAEQMVLEVMASTARMQDRAVNPPPLPPHAGDIPGAAPVRQVRELAECMWESAGRQYGMAQDFWLSAERHVLAMMRAAAQPPASGADPRATEWATLSPSAYLERIRVMAYFYWERAGRSYGEALDSWLRAERDVLDLMAASAGRTEAGTGAPAASPAAAPAPAPDSPPAESAQSPAATEAAPDTAAETAADAVVVASATPIVVEAPAEAAAVAAAVASEPALPEAGEAAEVGQETVEENSSATEPAVRSASPRKKAAAPKSDAARNPRAKGTQSPSAN